MGLRTPLYDNHLKMGAKIVDFGGWDMPLHYGSQIEEHHQVRKDCGMFDVSHMNVVDVKGANVRGFFRLLLANNVDKLKTKGKALYSCMLTAKGGVIDDLIVYYMDDQWFRVVMNAATREKDMVWVNAAAKEFGGLTVTPRNDMAMIAVQGPKAKEKVYQALGEALRAPAGALKPFHAVTVGELFIATTGYTGEDGFEIILPAKAASFTWQMLREAGVPPIGLGARDTLRLEAGMNLYGADMDETTSPLESGLAWTVALEPTDRKFIGREVLDKQKAQGVPQQLVGLVLEGKGMLRNHQKVVCNGTGEGEITSGSFSPTLNQAIALARVPAAVKTGDRCIVDLRGKSATVRVVTYPFVRHGKSCIST
ncbi:MAG: glycine cleavage system aminomethyltransferase GcvT [Gammaproteobacteria bacterium]|nr:glycine cleavage system aminomethyltransferase GcvT [Gammaproteobacteria bacterium]MDH3406951.1 glycine cleavage system aminomethyltransferase GcvT [Gammaproteobacteria bacterium]MDH5487177.1 glycine cleavage system aminomethyltransferase GcvT [Gammaproteobacteria bacterium]